VSSSPKEFLEESRISIEKREFIFSPDVELELNCHQEHFLENGMGNQKLFATGDLEESKLNNSVTKQFTPSRSSRLSGRRYTDNFITSKHKVGCRKKMDVGSETEDTLFNYDDMKKPLNTKELLNTINAIDACESLASQSHASLLMQKKSFNQTVKPSHKKNEHKFKGYCKNKIPSMKFLDGVLKNSCRK
jgi:hypothetical protein